MRGVDDVPPLAVVDAVVRAVPQQKICLRFGEAERKSDVEDLLPARGLSLSREPVAHDLGQGGGACLRLVRGKGVRQMRLQVLAGAQAAEHLRKRAQREAAVPQILRHKGGAHLSGAEPRVLLRRKLGQIPFQVPSPCKKNPFFFYYIRREVLVNCTG